MHGVLANIIEVPDELETAIEMCLGASLTKHCNRYRRRCKKTRRTFEKKQFRKSIIFTNSFC